MKINGKINSARRQVMQNLTKNIGTTRINKSAGQQDIVFKKVLISRPNARLGNMLLITPLIQEITAMFPHCTIDLFVKGGLAHEIFKNYPNVNRIIKLPKKPFNNVFKYVLPWLLLKQQKYNIVINVVNRSSSGRICATLVNAEYKFFGEQDVLDTGTCEDYENFAKKPVYNLRQYIKQSGLPVCTMPVAPVDIKLDEAEKQMGGKILSTLTNSAKPVICVFTYATAEKKYPADWWEAFYSRIETEFGQEYTLLEVLPIENVSQIGFRALFYYSRDIREIASVIANTALFIAADSGMMHLASSAQTPVVGLFRVTSPKIYRPYGNNSIGIDTNITNTDDCIAAIKTVLSKSRK